ncbi:ABC transporter ATP-binding protein [Mucilaginibacter sp. CAU 1740]|uniref:ABC transporter ATP-binding protein n=1 Tax=Mucilaginibacter sp. CAU 1740 TaxID=3140365 RepID=UPI00325B8A1D
MSDTPFFQAVAVSKIYPGKQQSGLKKTDLSIESGKITAIIGESGSGKSTLLKLLYGLISPDEGTVYFKGERIWGPEEKLIPGHDAMKMVTQHTDDLNLFAKVWDNIAAMLPATDLKAKQEKTERVLKQLNMFSMADKRVADLSGGEKQRVAIARAIVTQPEVLFLDEPFNQVDTSFREGLQHDIRQIVKETGITVIMVSHDPAEVLSMADELIVLNKGEIVETGNPKAMYKHPQNLYTAKLLTNCNIFNAAEAHFSGINTGAQYVVIYPEHVKIKLIAPTKNWTVKQVLFKGFYEELILRQGETEMRVLSEEPGKHTEGEHVAVRVDKWLEY